MNKINAAIRKLDRRILLLAFIVVTSLTVYMDLITGPLIPFALLYILLIYFSASYIGGYSAYLIAIIAALGRTYEVYKGYPPNEPVVVAIWQFITSLAVYSLICHLFNFQFLVQKTLEEKLGKQDK
ncbi:MAG TPA: hypothetical protein VIE91_06755 [Methylophilaceae bacterium]|jgi:hypothetical protein